MTMINYEAMCVISCPGKLCACEYTVYMTETTVCALSSRKSHFLLPSIYKVSSLAPPSPTQEVSENLQMSNPGPLPMELL